METIGRYQVKKELGRGGMATVFLAFDPKFKRDVAIKVLPHAFLHDPQFRARFEREATTIAQLEHPTIAPVYDFGEEGGQPFIVMRLMSGGDLSDKLALGALSLQETVSIVERVASALDAAHGNGIIHRDLKPGNILFDSYNNAFLSDFGIARLAASSSTLTGSAIIGTPSYMSPEQIQGDKNIDGRSDIYALGIILYQMLVGQMPYQADTPAKVMMMHILNPVPNILDIKPELGEKVGAVIERALAKDPDERFRNGKDLTEAFKHAIADEDWTQTAEPIRRRAQREESPTVRVETGALLEEPTAVPVAATQSSPQTPIPKAAAPPPRKTNWFLLIMGGVVGVILVGIAGFFAIGALRSGAASPEATATISFAGEANATNTAVPTATTPPTNTPFPTEEPTATLAAVVVADTATPAPPTATVPPTNTPLPTPTATPEVVVIGGADKIAFVINNDIWAMNVDGSDPVQLTTDGAGPKTSLLWKPDGSGLHYIFSSCIRTVNLDLSEDVVACFQVGELEDIRISPDGEQIAIALNREVYLVPYDLDALSTARFRTDLAEIATCEDFAPLSRDGSFKSVFWSEAGTEIAVKTLSAVNGQQGDLIMMLDISTCGPQDKTDEFPASRFTMKGYSSNPIIPSVDWDGNFLFLMNQYTRNGGFGEIYLYNASLKRGELKNPVANRCCYQDATWSPDGLYVAYAFQDILQGANSTTEIYYIPFANFGTGIEFTPLPLPEAVTNAREAPQIALRPAQ